MSAAIVLLTIIGVCLIIASFVFFEKDGTGQTGGKQVVTLNDYELDEQEIAKLQDSIRNVVKEYSDQLVENTDQQLNVVAGQKMEQISELAEQVLEEIKKNHQECVFLYDMLEDKSDKIKDYVNHSAEKLVRMEQEQIVTTTPQIDTNNETENLQLEERIVEPESQVQEHLVEQVKQTRDVPVPKEDLDGIEDVQERNQQILDMFHAGKEPLAIAKELNLGVGEVQLVVDLFQGDK